MGPKVHAHLLIMGPRVEVQITLTMRSILAIWEGEKRTNPPLGKGPIPHQEKGQGGLSG